MEWSAGEVDGVPYILRGLHAMYLESNWLHFILTKIVVGLKLLQSKVKSDMMWFCPKYKKGGYIVCKVTVDPTYRKQ